MNVTYHSASQSTPVAVYAGLALSATTLLYAVAYGNDLSLWVNRRAALPAGEGLDLARDPAEGPVEGEGGQSSQGVAADKETPPGASSRVLGAS